MWGISIRCAATAGAIEDAIAHPLTAADTFSRGSSAPAFPSEFAMRDVSIQREVLFILSYVQVQKKANLYHYSDWLYATATWNSTCFDHTRTGDNVSAILRCCKCILKWIAQQTIKWSKGLEYWIWEALTQVPLECGKMKFQREHR